MKKKITIENIIAYIQGNIRYKLYYSKNYRFRWMVSKYIQDTFKQRLDVIPKECLLNAQCKECGCAVPQLQFANKSCESKCYPPMKSLGERLMDRFIKFAMS